MHRLITLALALSLATQVALLTACQGAPADPVEARVGTSAAPRDAEQAAVADAIVPTEVVAELRRIEESVARIRGLQPVAEVPLAFLDRERVRQYFQESFDREYTPDERVQDRKLLAQLGLIPRDMDLAATLVDLLGEQVVGFYDDDQRRMTLVGQAAGLGPDDRITFAHEFTHALQDQHYGLKALNPPDSDDDDRSLAIQALVEGDATLVMQLWATQSLSPRELDQAARSGGDDRKLRQAPLVLRVELLFPYSEGLRFVQRLYERGGYGAVDQAFRDPPRSTEQILHPDKYLDGDQPVSVQLPAVVDLLGADWVDVTSNTLGELDLRILIEQYTDRTTATRAAGGWGGDRYRLMENGAGQLALVMKTTWDTQSDADEFHLALVQSIRRRFGAATGRGDADAPDLVAVTSADQHTLISKRGAEVVLVMAPDESTAAQGVAAVGH